jgi:hypothetical protein
MMPSTTAPEGITNTKPTAAASATIIRSSSFGAEREPGPVR